MGGFTINGFGAADSYYPLKELGTAHCPYCNAHRHYSLMELKMKIRVLFIPTVSIGTKYAVACTQCQNGYYVEEEDKNYILNHPASCVRIEADGVRVLKEQPAAQSAPVAAEPKPLEVQPQNECTPSEPPSPTPTEEPKPAPEQIISPPSPAPVLPSRVRKSCPCCKMLFTPEKTVCTICGEALIEKT